MPETDIRPRLSRWRAIRAWPTARALALFIIGLTALAIGIPTATVDLIRLGAFVAALPLVAGLAIVIWPPRSSATRLPPSPPLQVDVPSVLAVSIRGSVRLLCAGELNDHVPTPSPLELRSTDDESGPVQRIRTAHADTIVTPTRRGPLTLGPLTGATIDPLGAFRLRGTVLAATTHLVWPRTVDIPFADRLTAELAELVASTGFEANQAWDDASVREYRDGDGLRRVHWRSSARLGTLMVRADAPTTTDVITVALCPPAESCPGDERENLVTIATSIALAVLAGGGRASLTTAAAWAGRSSSTAFTGPSARTQLLDAAAILDAHDVLDPTTAASLPRPPAAGLLVTVSRSDDLQPHTIARLNGSRGLAVLVDQSAANKPTDRPAHTAPTGGAPVASLLADAGWHVITWGRS